MGVEITQDLYQSHNQTRWDPKKKAELRRKYGIVPRWANPKWRQDRRGYSPGMKPLRFDDTRFADVVNALALPPGDPEANLKDGKFHVGSDVLTIIDADEWDKSQARRVARGNRRIEASEKQQRPPGQYLEMSRPEMTHVKEGQPAIKSGDHDGSNRQKKGGK